MLVDVASVGKYCDIFHNRLVNLDVISNFIGAHLPAYTGYRAQGQAGAGARPRPSTIYIFSQSWLTYAFRSLVFLPVARNLSVMASLSAAVMLLRNVVSFLAIRGEILPILCKNEIKLVRF